MVSLLQSFNPNSRLIQLVHIFQSTLTNEARHRAALEIIREIEEEEKAETESFVTFDSSTIAQRYKKTQSKKV